MLGIKILGTGGYQPLKKVVNEDFTSIVETSDEWIRTRTGMSERFVSDGEPTWYMGTMAAKDAIAAAGISPEDIGVIIDTSVSSDYYTPSMSCMIQRDIPSTFSDDIVRGKQTQVSIFCDMSGLLYYKALLTANTNVSLAMNADIKVERSANTTDRQDEITAYPIEYEDVALYNPTNGFAAFLIPAVLVLIIQQTLLLGIGLSAGTAREQNRFRDLVPINRHYNGTLRIVMGKGLSYFMVYSLVSVYILCVVPWLFSLNQIAIPGVLTLFTLPYLAACIFFAMTASIAIRNRETCMLLFVFTSVPLLFLSGISWPGAAMPAFWKYFSYIFPSTFGINGYVRINSMGATLNEVSFEYQALWIQTGFYFITTCLVYRWQILQSRKHVIEEYKKHKSIEA